MGDKDSGSRERGGRERRRVRITREVDTDTNLWRLDVAAAPVSHISPEGKCVSVTHERAVHLHDGRHLYAYSDLHWGCLIASIVLDVFQWQEMWLMIRCYTETKPLRLTDLYADETFQMNTNCFSFLKKMTWRSVFDLDKMEADITEKNMRNTVWWRCQIFWFEFFPPTFTFRLFHCCSLLWCFAPLRHCGRALNLYQSFRSPESHKAECWCQRGPPCLFT